MKTLTDQTLLYDKDCPLCSVYTKGFIKMKFLDNNGRQAYSKLDCEEYDFVDLKRATNEIALIDKKNRTVIYGIDSLLKVISHSSPWVAKIGHIKPIKFGLKKLYSFISYNRKVIVPSKINESSPLQCVPEFNHKYRYTFILFAALITSYVLFKLNSFINLFPDLSILMTVLFVLGQIVFQSFFIQKLNKESKVNYLGNLMTISVMGSLLIIPILILNPLFNLPESLSAFWLALILMFTHYEHLRRLKLLELSKHLSITWLLYQSLLLIFLLIS